MRWVPVGEGGGGGVGGPWRAGCVTSRRRRPRPPPCGGPRGGCKMARRPTRPLGRSASSWGPSRPWQGPPGRPPPRIGPPASSIAAPVDVPRRGGLIPPRTRSGISAAAHGGGQRPGRRPRFCLAFERLSFAALDWESARPFGPLLAGGPSGPSRAAAAACLSPSPALQPPSHRPPPPPSPVPSAYTWIFALSCIFSFICAFGIGANDVANSFASSVGAKALTMPQARRGRREWVAGWVGSSNQLAAARSPPAAARRQEHALPTGTRRTPPPAPPPPPNTPLSLPDHSLPRPCWWPPSASSLAPSC